MSTRAVGNVGNICICVNNLYFSRMEKRERLDPQLKSRIDELIAAQDGDYNSEIVEDIMVNALKMLKDVKSRGDAREIHREVVPHRRSRAMR